jgi:hypothetical protein
MAVQNAINSGQALSSSSNVIFNTVIAAGGYAQHSISGMTTLTSADFGKQVLCTGSSAYTVTLPAVTADVYIDFMFLPTSNAIVTLSPASGTIDNQSTLPYVAGESTRLYCDGTNWWQIGYKMMPYTMQAGANGTTTTLVGTGAGNTQITLTASLDPSSWFTSNVFTPLYPGKWQVIGSCTAGTVATTGFMNVILSKNASVSAAYVNGALIPVDSTVSNFIGSIGTSFIQMNGSTDTLQLIVHQNSGGSMTTTGASSTDYLICKRISQY